MDPLFIIGNPRSGTTLLRLMLTCHPSICIPPESEFIIRLFPRYGHIKSFSTEEAHRLITDLTGKALDLPGQWQFDALRQALDPQTLVRLSYAGACEAIYMLYARSRLGKTPVIWGDKNNSYGHYLAILNYVFPSAKFIHLVRDGRAVLHSYRNLNQAEPHRYAPRLQRNPSKVAESWSLFVSMVDRDLGRLPETRRITLRYEDLVCDPAYELKRICDFAGLEYNSEMLRYDEQNRELELEPAQYEWKQRTREPVQKSRAKMWNRELAPEAVRQFEDIAAPSLKVFGYPCRNAHHPSQNISFVRRGFSILRRLRGHYRITLSRIRKSVS